MTFLDVILDWGRAHSLESQKFRKIATLVGESGPGIRIYRPTLEQTVKGPSTISVSMHRMLKRFVINIAIAKHIPSADVDQAPYRVFKPLDVLGSMQFTFSHAARLSSMDLFR